MTLDQPTAQRFAQLTLGHVGREYPHKLDHVMEGDGDVLPPRVLHPIFHGSFDFHSCVHGWWQLHRLARRFPGMPEASEIDARADALFTAANIAAEQVYFERPSSAGFVRPYGWGWLLALHTEMAGARAARFDPLARAVAARFTAHLPKLTYPIRVGTHFNTSFALIHARRWALAHDSELAALIEQRARDWFAGDRDCQAWEPGGDEFLSSALTEALLMREVLGDGFGTWFDAFLPRVPATLTTPAIVSDRSDGKIAHLDGLNLSRAWCWRGIADGLPAGHSAVAPARAAAERHLAAALPHLADDYMGEHWLATFALLALDDFAT